MERSEVIDGAPPPDDVVAAHLAAIGTAHDNAVADVAAIAARWLHDAGERAAAAADTEQMPAPVGGPAVPAGSERGAHGHRPVAQPLRSNAG